MVRGLGGNACDPTDTKCEDRNHCVVCELFGCTGWARKFRFEVLDGSGHARVKKVDKELQYSPKIERGQTFTLRFTPLRVVHNKELALLDTTLRLIADYGAIGGKTVLKPSDEAGREAKPHHKDYGLIGFVNPPKMNGALSALQEYISQDTWQKPDHDGFVWASLQNFWHVKGEYLGRENNNKSTFNQVLGRQEAKDQGYQFATSSDRIARWLAGSQQESKKLFSFKNPARTFGFVKPGLIDFNAMKQRLVKAWRQSGWNFLTGDEIIDQLFAGKEGRP